MSLKFKVSAQADKLSLEQVWNEPMLHESVAEEDLSFEEVWGEEAHGPLPQNERPDEPLAEDLSFEEVWGEEEARGPLPQNEVADEAPPLTYEQRRAAWDALGIPIAPCTAEDWARGGLD